MEALRYENGYEHSRLIAEDQVFGELQAVARRLQRIQRLASGLAIHEAGGGVWHDVTAHCVTAQDAVASAVDAIPLEAIEPSGLSRH